MQIIAALEMHLIKFQKMQLNKSPEPKHKGFVCSELCKSPKVINHPGLPRTGQCGIWVEGDCCRMKDFL